MSERAAKLNLTSRQIFDGGAAFLAQGRARSTEAHAAAGIGLKDKRPSFSFRSAV